MAGTSEAASRGFSHFGPEPLLAAAPAALGEPSLPRGANEVEVLDLLLSSRLLLFNDLLKEGLNK